MWAQWKPNSLFSLFLLVWGEYHFKRDELNVGNLRAYAFIWNQKFQGITG